MDIERYMESLHQFSDDLLIACAYDYLKGTARQWFASLSTSNSLPSTWNLFKEQIMTQFKPIDLIEETRTKLMTLRQTGTVRDYSATFRELRLILGSHRLPEDQAIHFFKHGLRPRVVEALEIRTYNNLNDIISAAIRVDTRQEIARDRIRHMSQSNVQSFRSQNPNLPRFPAATQQTAIRPPRTYVCHTCNKPGHLRRDCPQLRPSTSQNRFNVIATTDCNPSSSSTQPAYGMNELGSQAPPENDQAQQ